MSKVRQLKILLSCWDAFSIVAFLVLGLLAFKSAMTISELLRLL